MIDEVRPLGCPFCGASTTDVIVADYFHKVKVICLKCSAEFALANHFRNEKQAVIHAWNERHYGSVYRKGFIDGAVKTYELMEGEQE